MNCYNMSDHCKWLIVSGGNRISSPNRLMIVELGNNDIHTVCIEGSMNYCIVNISLYFITDYFVL